MILTKEQEEELFNRIANGDESARKELIAANLDLIESVANKYIDNDKNLSVEELKQIGRKGLEKAIDKFNPKKEYKFSTYASWWIRQAIHLALGIKDEKDSAG